MSPPVWSPHGLRIKRKMKKLFCMESHGQYMSHVSEKKARSRHKELMRHLGATVSSGSKGRIIDEEEWVQQHCSWTDSDTGQFPTNDARDPQFAITWSRSNALCLFGVSLPKGERV